MLHYKNSTNKPKKYCQDKCLDSAHKKKKRKQWNLVQPLDIIIFTINALVTGVIHTVIQCDSCKYLELSVG